MIKIFKWIGYIVLSIFILIFISLVFIGTSDRFIGFVADKYAPKYGFSYSKISGSLIGGVEIDKLAFKDKEILNSFKFSWSLVNIIRNRLTITNIDIQGLDVDNIKYTADSLAKEFKSKEKEESSSSGSLPISIALDNAHIDIKPFKQDDIFLDEIIIDINGILYNGKISVDRLLIYANSNIADINLEAMLLDERLDILNLSIKDVNSSIIEYMVLNKEESQESTTDKSNSEINPLVPTVFAIENIDVNILPREYKNIQFSNLALKGDGISLDISTDEVLLNGLTLNIDTNVTNISLDASLKGKDIIVDDLSLNNIDTIALLQIFGKESNSSNKTIKDEEDKKVSKPNPFMPKRLIINSLHSNIISAVYNPVKVDKAEINATNIYINIEDKIVNSADIKIDVDTNLTTLRYGATINNNTLESSGIVTPLDTLFQSYNIPLRQNAIKDIEIKLKGDKDNINAHISLNGTKLLDVNSSEFNVDNLELLNSIDYNIESKTLRVITSANISTTYAKEIILHNTLNMIDKEIDYKGLITANKFEGIDSNITDIVKDFQIEFNGNKNSIKALINSAYLAGEFVSKDFKNGDFNLSSKKDISFQTAKIGFNLSAPIDFNNTLPLNAKLNINSNIVDISSDIIYNKEIKVDSLVTTPKKSILRDIDKNLNLDMITPLNVNVVVANDISLNLSSKGIKGNLKLNKESKDINGNLDLVGFNLGFTGNIDKKIVLNNNIKSIEKLIKKLQSIYKFEAPNIDGDAKIELVLKNKKDIKLNLTSDEINFKVDRNTEHILNKTSISLGFSDGILELSKYQTIFQKQKIFATKPSVIKFESPLVTISPLWINDELKVTGVYDIKEKNGDILAYANPLSISHEVIKLKTLIDIKTKLKGGDINVRGDITILNGRLFLNMDRKSFSSSSDIIIVQNQKPKESEEQKNLDLLLNLHTKKALVYKSKDANIKIKPNMVIQKSNGSPLQILGSVEIVDGSYYKFQNKKFVVKKSIVAFTGNPKNPLLDISAIYNSINYEITIHITGDPQIPNIMFSSIPRLTREQILSVILFDNESAGDSSSADDMMKMMGGAMAKSALSGIGVKIDHLSLGSDGTMEVGKKISDKVTIIYVNDEVSSARLEYDWTKNIKASITSDGESSGADIVFRREF